MGKRPLDWYSNEIFYKGQLLGILGLYYEAHQDRRTAVNPDWHHFDTRATEIVETGLLLTVDLEELNFLVKEYVRLIDKTRGGARFRFDEKWENVKDKAVEVLKNQIVEKLNDTGTKESVD